MSDSRKNKEETKWVGSGIIVGRFGGKYALVHFRGSYFEVDLCDMRPANSPNSLFDLIGRDGALKLHVHSTMCPIHYLVDSQTLILLTRMRSEFLNRNQTTRANTDTRIKPQAFYEPDLQQRIAIRELGGGR